MSWSKTWYPHMAATDKALGRVELALSNQLVPMLNHNPYPLHHIKWTKLYKVSMKVSVAVFRDNSMSVSSATLWPVAR